MSRVTASASGAVASFRSPGKVPVRGLTVNFSPVQSGSGDPSPSNVRPITGWTGVNVTQEGKNLLNTISENIIPYKNSGYTNYTLSNGTVVTTGNTLFGFKVACRPSTKYTLSFNSSFYGNGLALRAWAYSSEPLQIKDNDTAIAYVNDDDATFTTPVDCSWLVCGIFANYGIVSGSITMKNFQLELGEKKTAYEPYRAITTLPVTFPSEAGTVYGGSVDLVTGELTVEWASVELETLSWNAYGSTEQGNRRISSTSLGGIIKPPGQSSWRSAAIAAKYKTVIYSSFDYSVYSTICVTTVGALMLAYDNVNSPTGQFVYPLATPLTYTLTPQQLSTLIGSNTIYSDGDSVQVEYDLAESAEMMRVRQRIMSGFKPFGTLVYWLSGKDAPVNNGWNGRVGDIRFGLTELASYNSVGEYYDFGAESKYGAFISMKKKLDIGNHFYLTFDMDINFAETTSTFLDIGSVTSTNKGIGFTIKTGMVNINWKMQGNNSNPGLTNLSHSGVPNDEQNAFVPVTGWIAIIDGGDGYDRLKAKINGVTETYNVQIPQVYYGPTWSMDTAYIGRGYLSQTNNASIRVRDIKIFRID